MSDSVFSPNEDTKIDAEFMEKWLGGVEIDSLSPKVLFDLQTLMSHYKDIIVPMEDVSVEFPVEGVDTACASVDNMKIFIPTGTLQKGYIDDTIGLVIHELNHLKHSEKESFLVKVCSNFLMPCLDSIFVEADDGNYLSLKDLVYKGGFEFSNLLKGEPKTKMEEFFGECLRGVLLLLNSAEDVRIDTICPPNLRKYITKMDDRTSVDFISEYDTGALSEDTLMNIVFRLLYHHKGYIHDESISNRFGETEFIIENNPRDYIPGLLSEFKNEIKNHCEAIYNAFDFTTPSSSKNINDEYLSQMEESSQSQQFEKELGDAKEFSDECVKGVEFEDSELDENNNALESEFQQKQQEEKKLLTVPQYLKASIDVFRNVVITDCHEQFITRDGDVEIADYKTLLIG